MTRRVLRIVRLLAATALIITSLLAQHALRAQPTGITRTDLQRHDLSAPDREAVQVRVDFAPGAGFPRHSHPGGEIIYVLAGSLEYRLDGKAPMTLKAGDVLFVPAGTIHAAKNAGDSVASELATYVVEKGKPLLTLAE